MIGKCKNLDGDELRKLFRMFETQFKLIDSRLTNIEAEISKTNEREAKRGIKEEYRGYKSDSLITAVPQLTDSIRD